MVSRLRVPRWNAEYSSVNAPWTYFFSPAGPDRSVVSSNPATGAAAIRVRISPTASMTSPAALPRQEWTNPADTAAGQVGDQLRPLDRDVLEDRQVDRHRRQAGADRQRRVRHPGRARRDVDPPAGAPRLVQVVLVPSAAAAGTSSC